MATAKKKTVSKPKETGVYDDFKKQIAGLALDKSNDLFVSINESELTPADKQALNIELQCKMAELEQAEIDSGKMKLEDAKIELPSEAASSEKAVYKPKSGEKWIVYKDEKELKEYEKMNKLKGYDPGKKLALILTSLLVAVFLAVTPAFGASLTDEAVLGNDRWSVTTDGDLVPNANTYTIGDATHYPASIWVNGSEYTSFAAGSDGNWTDQGLTVTLDGAPTKFIMTKSSGDNFATGFTVGTGDITFANGGKIDGDTANEIRLIENSDTLKVGFSGDDITLDATDGGVRFILTDATDGTVDVCANNDSDDCLVLSTAANVPTIGTNGSANLAITSDSGAITFSDENLTTTGTLSAGATTVTSLIIGDETFSVPADDTIRVASNDAQTIFNVYTAATSNEDAVLLLSADASADNGDDWQLVSDGATNSLFFQNDTSGSQATFLTLATTGLLTTTGDVTVAGTTPLVTIGDGGDEDAGIQINSDTNDFYIASENSADTLILGEGSSIGTTPIITLATGGVTTVTGATDGDLTIYGAGTSASDAYLRLVGDAGADASDRWQLMNDSSGAVLLIQSDSAVAGTYVTKMTIASADGDITTTGDVEIIDDMDLVFGTNADWKVQYDEGVDDQLLFITANTAAGATTDPMVEFLVGATPTADQQVFGVAKGTQASNTALLTLDEDGDMVVAGNFAPTAITVPTETVAATNVLTAAESGKVMFLNHATEFASTLPAISAAPAGTTFTFIITGSPVGANYTVLTGNSLENILVGGINELEVDTSDDGPYIADGDTITFVGGTSVVGDYVTVISDGTKWYLHGQANADGGITLTQAD